MVSFNANGGTVAVASWGEYEVINTSLVGYVDVDNTLWLGDTTITFVDYGVFYFEGYTLVGWSYTVSGDVIGDFTVNLTQDTTLYAVWAETITVTIDANGGDFSNSDLAVICWQYINVVSYAVSDDFTQVTLTVAVGDSTWLSYIVPGHMEYAFAGYNYDSDATSGIEIMEFYADTTIYAIWTTM